VDSTESSWTPWKPVGECKVLLFRQPVLDEFEQSEAGPPFDKILNLFYISTYAATLHVLSFAIIGNIHWPHDPVFTLRKMSHATLWQAAEEIGTTFWQFVTLCHDHLADAATTATAKTVTLDRNCHAFASIHLRSSKHPLDALEFLYLRYIMWITEGGIFIRTMDHRVLLPGLFDAKATFWHLHVIYCILPLAQ